MTRTLATDVRPVWDENGAGVGVVTRDDASRSQWVTTVPGWSDQRFTLAEYAQRWCRTAQFETRAYVMTLPRGYGITPDWDTVTGTLRGYAVHHQGRIVYALCATRQDAEDAAVDLAAGRRHPNRRV